jgi:outer membrane protein OmpA-like peptidoglycan-associated protein
MTSPRRVTHPLSVLITVAVLVLAGGSARAQYDRSFSPQLFHPAPGPDEFVNVETAVPLPHKSFGVGLFFNYARNEISLIGVNAATGRPDGAHADLLANALSADLWAGVGLWNRFQIALALPMTLYQNGSDFNDANPMPQGTHVKAANGFALGDPRIHLKARLLGKDWGPQLAISHWLSIPVGNDAQFGGEKHFSGFSGEPRVLGGWEGKRWRAGVYIGFLWRAHTSELFSTVAGQQLTYGGALAFDVAPGRFTVLGELYGHSNSFNSFKLGSQTLKDLDDAPLELDVAGKIVVAANLSLTVGVGYGVVPAVGSPQPRVYTGLVWARDNHDRDHDGVPDAFDKCPDTPEDRDGFQDSDGCPDPDNDGDTIPDKQDKCPNEPEDFDSFQDDDGCPDPDNDKDGIDDLHDACPNDPEDHKPPKPNDGCPLSKTDTDGDGITDDKDKCPTEPEDKDGFQDDDGCPDPDNDNDGIPDNFDQCPNEPEDMDGFQDEDGCPDPDNDKDGIPDKDDKCPNEPETINGYQDEDGCPDKGPPTKVKVDLEHKQIVILDKIFFDTDKATIKPVSFSLLDQVAQTLKGYAELKIRIEGHTDSQGRAAHNQQLSQERADSVRTYLIKKGIAPERLVSVGYGSGVPIADNKTKAGREANRRVEFHIVEEPRKKKSEEGGEPADDAQAQPADGKAPAGDDKKPQ